MKTQIKISRNVSLPSPKNSDILINSCTQETIQHYKYCTTSTFLHCTALHDKKYIISVLIIRAQVRKWCSAVLVLNFSHIINIIQKLTIEGGLVNKSRQHVKCNPATSIQSTLKATTYLYLVENPCKTYFSLLFFSPQPVFYMQYAYNTSAVTILYSNEFSR